MARLKVEPATAGYLDAKTRERQRLLAELQVRLERAFARSEPWYMWVLWRRNGEHHHDLVAEDGLPVACPVAGCDAVRTMNVREPA